MIDRLPSTGLAALRNPYAGSVAAGGRAERPQQHHAEQHSVSLNRADSFELSITTAEGDIVTLDLSQQQTYNATGTMVRSGKGQALALDVQASNELNVQVSVKGNLNAKEAASINALVNQVNGVAQDFFAGDMQKATAAASTISIANQADTLSAYAFDMQTQEVRRAVSTYTDVAAATAPQAPLAVQLPDAPAQAAPTAPQQEGSFLKSLLALFEVVMQGSKDAASAASTPAPQTPV